MLDDTTQPLPSRPRSHVLEEESRRAFRSALPSEWIIRDVWEDYGADLSVEIFESSVPTGCDFLVQLKATDSGGADKPPSITIPRSTINYLRQRQLPAMVVAYQAAGRRLYYVWLDEFMAAREYKRPSHELPESVHIVFSDARLLTSSSTDDILGYFRPAGVPAERAKELIAALSAAGADERLNILRELRFLRTRDGVLYLLSILPLDAVLDQLDMVDASADALDAFLEVCLNRPTSAATMLFWGVSAHIASGEKNTYTTMATRLFDALLPKLTLLDAKILAVQSYELFGYSCDAGIERIATRIRKQRFRSFATALQQRIRLLRTQSAPRPSAPDMFAALYTVDIVDSQVVYLNDSELEALWRAYQSGREALLEFPDDAEEMAIHGRGYFEALREVYGYQLHLEDRSDAEFQLLLKSMATKKVDLFMNLVALKEHREGGFDTSSQADIVRRLAADMLVYTRVYWFSQALDWFRLSCFCRTSFHGNR